MKNIYIALIIIFSIIISGCTTNCDKVWNKIYDKVQDANYCNTDEECVIADTTCCGSLVNIKEKGNVEKFALDQINKNQICLRDCNCWYPEPEDIKCKNNKCIDMRFS